MAVVQSPVVTVDGIIPMLHLIWEDKYVACAVDILPDVSRHNRYSCFAFKYTIKGVGSTCRLNVCMNLTSF